MSAIRNILGVARKAGMVTINAGVEVASTFHSFMVLVFVFVIMFGLLLGLSYDYSIKYYGEAHFYEVYGPIISGLAQFFSSNLGLVIIAVFLAWLAGAIFHLRINIAFMGLAIILFLGAIIVINWIAFVSEDGIRAFLLLLSLGGVGWVVTR